MANVAEKLLVAPFVVEADHPRNSDLMLQAIPGCRLRSRIEAGKHVIDAKTGEQLVPQDQSRHLGQFPPIPGMQVHVNPAKLTAIIVDPLYDDEELCEKIRRAMERSSAFRVDKNLRGVEPKEEPLDQHRMKTLVREMIWIVEAGEGKIKKGKLPEMDDVDDLPGNYLLNPGSRVFNSQPTFEKDWDGWVEQLTRAGG